MAFEALLQQCKSAIERISPGATLILYGSRARREAIPGSDFDLLILIDEPRAAVETRIEDALYEIELRHGVVISDLIYERGTWDDPLHRAMPLHESIRSEGVRL